MKRTGWFNESKRHSLASRGIKTAQKIPMTHGLDIFETHQKAIALKTLKMPDAMVGVMGGMNKEQARAFLKKIGYTDKQIQDIEGNGSEPKKEYNVYLGDDGSLDTIVEVNGKDIRFDTEYASQFRNKKGEITKKGWEQLKKEAIDAYEDMGDEE